MSVIFHDLHPAEVSLKAAVLEGLGRSPKAIPPKFFYDAKGSRLFDAILDQPEYYIPKVERRIVAEALTDIVTAVGTDRVLIEPGAGSADKVRWLLDDLKPRAYVPIDISGEHLRQAADRLAADYPALEIHAVCGDISHTVAIPDELPPGPRLVFYPGSSLGNFHPSEARELLIELRELSGGDGMLLIGVDTKKPENVLQAAYNDAQGVTAAFNLNLLERIKRELDGDVQLDQFRHQAFYNPNQGRIEMHLESLADQAVRIDGKCFEFRRGETLHTENSYKYAPDEFRELAAKAGFRLARQWQDTKQFFAVYLLAPA